MIGERLESQHNLPLGASLLVAAGLCLAAAGLICRINALVVVAALPLALGGSLWLLGQERHFTATFHEEAIEIESDMEPILIPYASIQNIKVGGQLADPLTFRKSSCPIAVMHDRGVLHIPSRLNFPSHEVYRFLARRVPGSGGRDINPVLADYRDRQERQFGPDSVWTFRAASRRVTGTRRGYRAFCVGLIVTGAAWLGFGLSGFSEGGWAVAGGFCVFFGAILYAASFTESTPVGPVYKHWKKASLVIGRQGMAMVQGDIQGEVQWPELLDIRFNAKPLGFHIGSPTALPGILLRFKGANLVIADIYDRPLYVIHNRILASSGRSASLDLDE